MPTEIKTYACNICGSQYESLVEAQRCEEKGLEAPVVEEGDIVFLHSGFGWFDGDPKWVSNLKTIQSRGIKKCPKKSPNCFSSCCTYRFFYVVTKVTRHQDDPHRTIYHVVTLAMTGSKGHHNGWTSLTHFRPKKVQNPPEYVVKTSKALLGKEFNHLLP